MGYKLPGGQELDMTKQLTLYALLRTSHPTACSFPSQSSYLEGSPPVSSYTETGNS